MKIYSEMARPGEVMNGMAIAIVDQETSLKSPKTTPAHVKRLSIHMDD